MKCSQIIQQGKNRGKKCGDVHPTCNHVNTPLTCHCGQTFDRSSSYNRHLKVHKVKVDVRLKTNSLIDKLDQFEKKHSEENAMLQRQMEELLRRQAPDELLRKQVEELLNRPQATLINISVVDKEFYEKITAKLGTKEANAFLNGCCLRDKPLEIFQKLYLDGLQPENYPIACRNSVQFRYLNEKRELVEDNGGKVIGHLIKEGVHNAMILATNETMTEIIDGTIGPDEFDMRTAQSNLMKVKEEKLIKELGQLTENPNHKFFSVSECNKAAFPMWLHSDIRLSHILSHEGNRQRNE